MTPQPDGLAALTQSRERRHRRMPPARNPIAPSQTEAAKEATPAEVAVETSTTPTTGKDTPAPKPVQPVSQPTSTTDRGAKPKTKKESSEHLEALSQLTVMLEESQVDWLDQIRILGLTSKPKLDITRSAVIRLAVSRLTEQMNPKEIAQWFARQPESSVSTGRKRR